MKTTSLHLLKLTLLSALAVHLTMHALYLAPSNPGTHIYIEPVNQYMGTFFTQNWHLFAPEPATSSLQLSYRCNATVNWEYPLNDLFKEHKAFPFTAKGKQTYVLQNLAREIFNSKIKNTPEDKIPELTILQRYLKDQCGQHAQAQVQIKRAFTQDYSKRFQATEGKTEIFTFGIQNEAVVWN